MASDHIIFAGVDLSSGRKPVTFAALDDDLNVLPVENWAISEALDCLEKHRSIWLCINLHSFQREQELYTEFKKKIGQTGFKTSFQEGQSKTVAGDKRAGLFSCPDRSKPFASTYAGRTPAARAILYEQGLQIRDPVEIFEEITRYKLVQGILPLEDIYSSKELDALMAAYVAWMAVNSPGQIVVTGEFVLPAQE